MQFTIRAEHETDKDAIFAVTRAAFGQPDEARLVDLLRADGDAAISLVAEQNGAIIGHVLFSPLTGGHPNLALAPVSVAPDFQGNGVGSTLIKTGIEIAQTKRFDGVFVLGDPDYYGKFGFTLAMAEGFDSPFAGSHFMALELKGGALSTPYPVTHAPAFSKL